MTLFEHENPMELISATSLPRYHPHNFREAMISVYNMWNVLDRLTLQKHFSLRPWAFGHFLPVQVEKLVRLVRRRQVRTYCEVGFNGGHSAVAVLASTRNVTVISFDSAEYGQHTRQNAAWVSRVWPERFRFVLGDSRQTLRSFATMVRNATEPSCDVILVDGSHDEQPVLMDLRHFCQSASKDAPLILDDLDSPAGLSVLHAVSHKWIEMTAWYIYHVTDRIPPFPCKRCVHQLPNLTSIHDPERRLFPCIRWVNHGCKQSWDPLKCRRCDDAASWGIARCVV